MDTLEIAASITSDEYIRAPVNRMGTKANVLKSDTLMGYLRSKVIDGNLALSHSDLMLMSTNPDLHDQVCAHIALLSR